jgi:hypothetical protein
MVNDGGRRVFVEREGALELVTDRTLESRNLTVAIKNIARACSDEISEMQPILDGGGWIARRGNVRACAVAGPAQPSGNLRAGTARIWSTSAPSPEMGSIDRRHRDTAERVDFRWDRHGQNDTPNALAARIPDGTASS